MAIDLRSLMHDAAIEKLPDIHLQVGKQAIVRGRGGDIKPISSEYVLTKEDIEEVIKEITNEKQREILKENKQVDFSYQLTGVSRFRVNVFYENKGPAVAFRLISEKIPTMDEIGLDEIVKSFAMLKSGLVLFTGSTGMGKTTTIASVLEFMNQNRNAHVITIEDPIEFVYEGKNCLFSQRELNVHTNSFSDAIRGALRQDPDVVMVGEMRDLETISAALTLAETGHLVLSTLHTSDAAQTVDRIIDVFPHNQQQQIRAMLSANLKAVISQQLIPRIDEEGRIAARELMIVNDAIRNCIYKGEANQIYSIIQINSDEGMRLMDQALEELYKNGVISLDEAIARASDSKALYTKLV